MQRDARGWRAMAAILMVGISAVWVAGAAIGSHESQQQSICVRAADPSGAPHTVSLEPDDPNGEHCGQWICNAAVNGNQFVPPQPCTAVSMTVNITSGDTIGMKPLVVPTGTWTLTIYLKNLDTDTTVGPFSWPTGSGGVDQRTFAGSAHWKVHTMTGSGVGAFEIWFGDPLAVN